MSADPYTEGVEFVLDEVIRYARMSMEELRPHLKDLAFHQLKDAEGQPRLVGRAALLRLQELVENTLQSSPFKHRLDLDRTNRFARERFGETFLRADLPSPSESELKALFEGWIVEAAQDCRPRVHLIPCDLTLNGVDGITIGPVTLQTRERFSPGFEAELEAYLQECADDRWGGRAVASVRDYLGAFREMAEVEVPDCDEPTSRAVAEAALQTVLDFIHVMAGAGYTGRMRGPGPAVGADRRAEVARVEGRLVISSSIQFGGARIADTGWREFAGADGKRWLAPLAATLQAIVERRDLPLIADRFVDACAWYGDAAREPSQAAAAVKYVTVMERLLWTGETGGGVTRRVAKRLAALCFSTETWNFSEIEKEVRDAYDLRSCLLHGRISKSDPTISRRLRLCERHARDLLHVWWDRFGAAFTADVSLNQLRDHLDKLAADAGLAARHESV